MTDWVEKIGQFYLGEETWPAQGTVLYDAADLTTHAVIIGMTGSGKTGLGICLLEEAALDGIPVIAIDPKGDLGNLALNFPTMQADDFQPWADATALAQSGQSAAQWAEVTAKQWRDGIAASGQSSERMQALKNANPVHLFTPGSQSALPLSLLGALTPPDASVREDRESYAQTLDATVSSLFALLGKSVETLSPEHVFLTHILKAHWDQGTALDLATLIREIQNPPFNQIGVLPLDQVFPEKSRNALALSLNSLLASPSFASWQIGQPLECETLFYDAQKKPQTSVLNIAHLSDSERMFFLTLLLSNLIGWMRRQQGSSTLRAILYMDEIAGYLPPNANPPSKALLLTLLKQARAFGLGIVLSSQNPIDLDYKALSNAGTWLIGRLQTAQDRARVTEGLLSAGDKGINKTNLDQWFDQLGKRQFLLHNVHEETPCIFRTRWAMSYLAGPLSTAQIRRISAQTLPVETIETAPQETASSPAAIVPGTIATRYLPSPALAGATTNYFPSVMAQAQVFFQDKSSDTRVNQQLRLNAPFHGNAPDWAQSQPLAIPVEQLQTTAQKPAIHHPAPTTVQDKKQWQDWESALKTWLRQQHTLTLLHCPELKQYSDAGEDETTFRNRLAPQLRELRDREMMRLRQKLTQKQLTLNRQIVTAENALQREQSQASGSLLNAGIAIGSALLGAFTGRKVLSQTNIRRTTTALRNAGKVGKERQDIGAAQEKLALLQEQQTLMENTLREELAALQARYDPLTIVCESVEIGLQSQNIEIRSLALLYQSL